MQAGLEATRTLAADEIWDRLEAEEIDEISFESWTDDEDLQAKLLEQIVKELNLDSLDDEVGFECSLGATTHNGGSFFWRSRGPQTPVKAERWQILSPVRGPGHGVAVLNRVVQQTFRKTWLSRATSLHRNRRIHRPVGPQGIIYGDKVINLKNSSIRDVYPERPSYVANGDVGIVVGNFKTKKQREAVSAGGGRVHVSTWPRLRLQDLGIRWRRGITSP